MGDEFWMISDSIRHILVIATATSRKAYNHFSNVANSAFGS